MARSILQQPDGKWCVFSTIVDDFLYVNGTLEEIQEILTEEAIENARLAVEEAIERARKKENRGFYRTYEDALETRNRVHGEKNEENSD